MAYHQIHSFAVDKVYGITIKADCVLNQFAVWISCEEEELIAKTYRFNTSVYSLERLVFQTKDRVNNYDLESNGKDGSMSDLPNAGRRAPETKFVITMVKTMDHLK